MKLSVQLYTVRNQYAEDPIGSLKKLKDIGLNYVEGPGFCGAETAAEGRKILDDSGLKSSAAGINYIGWEDGFEKTMEDAHTMGSDYVVIPWIDKSVYENGWIPVAHEMTRIGKAVKAAGLTLLYHNHDFEFANDGLNTLYDNSDPEYLKALLDVAWCQIGGTNPVVMIEKLLPRLPFVHLKDFDMDKTPQWTVAGQGKVNWDEVLPAVAKGNVEFGSIELDESPGDPFDAVAESTAFFRSRGIVD